MMRRNFLLAGAFLAMSLHCSWLSALENPTSKETVHPEAGLSIVAPTGWTTQVKTDQDSELIFVLKSPTEDGTLTISGSQEKKRSLRGLWTGLRYSVVCDQGASIIQDQPLVFGPMSGRQLLYQTYLGGNVRKTLHCSFVSHKHFITAIFQGSKFDAQLPAVKSSIMSLKWSTSKIEASPTPSEEVKSK